MRNFCPPFVFSLLLIVFSCICNALTCDCDPEKLVLWSEFPGSDLGDSSYALTLFSAETDAPFAGSWHLSRLDERPWIPRIVRPDNAHFVERQFRARQQKSTFERFAVNWVCLSIFSHTFERHLCTYFNAFFLFADDCRDRNAFASQSNLVRVSERDCQRRCSVQMRVKLLRAPQF